VSCCSGFQSCYIELKAENATAELGMTNVPESWPQSDYIDVEAVNYIKLIKGRHGEDETALAKAKKGIQAVGRDNARYALMYFHTSIVY
jgi:hypothetical protein